MKKFVVIFILQLVLVACGSNGRVSFNTAKLSSTDNGEDVTYPSPSPSPANDSMAKLKPITDSQSRALLGQFIPQVNATGTDNRYSSALFGIARDMIEYSKVNVSFEQINVPMTQLKNGTLPVQFHRSKNGKAPLAIILNPLFSGELENQMARYKEFYGSREFHVLVFINTWSSEFIAKAPVFMPGNVWNEGKMHLEAIDKIVNQVIGKDKIDGATLIGVSYGAFMTSIVKYYDQKRSVPIITGPTVIVSPPHDMLNSLKNIDRQVLEVNAWADGFMCLLSGGFVGITAEALNKDDYNDANVDEKCSKYIFTMVGFNETLKMAVRNMNTSKKMGLTDATINALTYQKYLKDVAKLNPSVTDSDLGYWMNESKKLGYDKFVVMTSKDDNINEGNLLLQNKYYKFNTSNLFWLPTGGHTGFTEAKSTNMACSYSWQICALKAVYNEL